MIEAGESAPDFTLKDENGESVTLSDFKGKQVVLYFYPKDDTPGCTVEAQNFSTLKEAFDQKNTVVFGISKDSVKSHADFCGKYQLNVRFAKRRRGPGSRNLWCLAGKE